MLFTIPSCISFHLYPILIATIDATAEDIINTILEHPHENILHSHHKMHVFDKSRFFINNVIGKKIKLLVLINNFL